MCIWFKAVLKIGVEKIVKSKSSIYISSLGKIGESKKGISKQRKKEHSVQFTQDKKFAKANHAYNGHDKSNVKYRPMCYAACEVLTRE